MDEELIELEEELDEIVVDVEESIGFVGGNTNRHDSMTNRNDENQHEIVAITGLSDELKALKGLKTIYSNKIGVANYYKWHNNEMHYDYGYFVSLASVNSIKKCNGNNNDAIFGVTVNEAAFIGGQEEVVAKNIDGSTTHTLLRDNSYALVTTTGLVTVRCASSVAVGDYVVADVDGTARKTATEHGYKVIAIHTDDGVTYASIMLGVQADVTDKMSASVNNLDSRLKIAETDSFSAINLANQVMGELEKIDTSKLVTSDKLESIEGAANDAVSKAEGALSDAINASLMASKAKEIANSAVTAAEGIKNEAITKANEALDETKALREEFGSTADTMKDNLDRVSLEFQELSSDLEPLAEWGDGKGVAGFVAKATENEVLLGEISRLEGNFGTSLSGFVSSATSENAEIQALAQYNGGAAGLISTVGEHESKVSTIATLQGDVAGLTGRVSDNESAVDIVSKKILKQYTVIDSFDNADKTKTDVVYYDEKTKKYHYYENNVWKETTDAATSGLPVAIAGIQTKTDENSSNIKSLTSWQGTTKNTMARLEQKADENGAYIQSTVANMDKYAVGPHSQAYGFTLEQAADILEEGIMYVPTEDMTKENGKAETYSYTEDDEKKTFVQEFYREFLYRWSKINNQCKWIAVDKNYSEIDVNTSGPSVYFVNTMPTTVDTTHGYWYKTGDAKDGNGDIIETEYEPYVLYKWSKYVTKDQTGNDVDEYTWFPVATLAGNSKSRAVSQIRQDADKISASVTNIEGSVAGIQTDLRDTNARVQTVTEWQGTTGQALSTFMNEAGDKYASASQVANIVDKDGNIKAASIVAVVNENASSINLSADYVTIDGFTAFKGDVTEDINDTVINSYVEYARASSSTQFDSTTQKTSWNTTAPDWTQGEYMWQRIVSVKKGGNKTESNPVCIQGAKGQDGTGVTIKGVAYIKDVVVGDNIVNTEHLIYQDSNCTTQITNPADSDSYLVDGYLFVYSGKDNKFTCVGKIQGPVGGSGITPVLMREWKEFAVSTSDTTAPTTGWGTSPSGYDKSNGKIYIWTRTAQKWDTDGDGKEEDSTFYSAASLDNSSTSISAWCVANNTTLIDGANLATGTVTADKMTVVDSNGQTVFHADATTRTVKLAATSIDGSLTIGQLPSNVATSDKIPTKTSQLTNDSNLAYKADLDDYVTNTSLSQQLTSYATTGELSDYLKTDDLQSELGDLNVVYRGDVQTTQTTDETTGLVTTTSQYVGTDGQTHTTTTYTTAEGDYVLLNRDNQWGSGDSLVKIEKDGLLQANNAVITGTVYATDGEFTGTVHATDGEFTGTVHATDGDIGGWQINDGGIEDNFYRVGIISTDDRKTQSLVNTEDQSSIRFYAGLIAYESERTLTWTKTINPPYSENVTQILNMGHNSFLIENVEIQSVSIAGNPYSNQDDWEDSGVVISQLKISDYNAISFKVSTNNLMEYTSEVEIIFSIHVLYGSGVGPNGTNYNFMVLEDGSLYANAAQISGEINATKGSFSGNIEAHTGKIGSLNIQDNAISSGTGEIAFWEDGSINAANLYASENVETKKLQLAEISGKLSESPSLYFDGLNAITRRVFIKHSYAIESKGDIRVDNVGRIVVTVNTFSDSSRTNSTTLYNDKVFTVYAHYKNTDKFLTFSLKVKKGQGVGTCNIPYYSKIYNEYGVPVYYEFDQYGVTPDPYDEDTPNFQGYISSSGSIVPTKTGLNIGQVDGPTWDYAYLGHTTHSSDRKIKDNICDIEDKFSAQLINGLQPKAYTLKTANTPRTHYGFIAQEVEELLHSLGTSADEVGLVCKSLPGEPDGENNFYSLNYTNLIAPMVDVIQQLSRRVEELENKLNTQQND